MEEQVISVQKQIAARNEQDQHLRDNIMLARKEVWLPFSFLLLALKSITHAGSASHGRVGVLQRASFPFFGYIE